MGQLLEQAQRLQQGLVKATVNGAGEVLGLRLAPQAVDPADTETLADLIIAAIRDATRNAEQAKARALGPLMGGMGGLGAGGAAGPSAFGGGTGGSEALGGGRGEG